MMFYVVIWFDEELEGQWTHCKTIQDVFTFLKENHLEKDGTVRVFPVENEYTAMEFLNLLEEKIKTFDEEQREVLNLGLHYLGEEYFEKLVANIEEREYTYLPDLRNDTDYELGYYVCTKIFGITEDIGVIFNYIDFDKLAQDYLDNEQNPNFYIDGRGWLEFRNIL